MTGEPEVKTDVVNILPGAWRDRADTWEELGFDAEADATRLCADELESLAIIDPD